LLWTVGTMTSWITSLRVPLDHSCMQQLACGLISHLCTQHQKIYLILPLDVKMAGGLKKLRNFSCHWLADYLKRKLFFPLGRGFAIHSSQTTDYRPQFTNDKPQNTEHSSQTIDHSSQTIDHSSQTTDHSSQFEFTCKSTDYRAQIL
jgi:hypothetical protein